MAGGAGGLAMADLDFGILILFKKDKKILF